jgi:hypothetical protein
MPGQWEELTDEFEALADDGQRFHMLVYTTMLDAPSHDHPWPRRVEGPKRVCTSDGLDCNRIDDETFEIVEYGLQVKRS